MGVRVLELGSYIVPAYAGMVLAEQGADVTKWHVGTDPMLGLNGGHDLWAWINHGKQIVQRPAKEVLRLARRDFDIVIDNIRLDTWLRWGVYPEEQAERLGCTWVSERDDFNGRSFDLVAQARAWGDIAPMVPFYIGDTAVGLWLAFKALALHTAGGGHAVITQAAALAKLVEGEMVAPRQTWDQPGTYEVNDDHVAVTFRGEVVREPYRDVAWRRDNLAHHDGRFII